MLDFTFGKYLELCNALVTLHHKPLTIRKYLDRKNCLPPKLIILRHDIDRKPKNALKMARLEATLGLEATYYFRYTPTVFQPDIIHAIAGLGHEIGYHYEVLVKTHGNYDVAIRLFEEELAAFRKICRIDTISMHGSPLSRLNNLDLWKRYDLEKYAILGDAYLSLDYKRMMYFSDTGRTWHPAKYNVRDRVPATNILPRLESTNDLIRVLLDQSVQRACLLVHPNRWADSRKEWMKEYLTDFFINQVKRVIILARGGA